MMMTLRKFRVAVCRGFTMTELLASVGITLVVAALIVPGISKARQAANSAKSVANLKTLARAALAFAADNNGQLPFYLGENSAASSYSNLYWFQYLVRDYCDADFRVLLDPNDDFKKPSGAPRFTSTIEPITTFSYGMNNYVPQSDGSGMSQREKTARMSRLVWISNPGQTAIFMETRESPALGPASTDIRFSALNGTAANISFLDGSARPVPRNVLLRSETTPETINEHQQLWYGDSRAYRQILR